MAQRMSIHDMKSASKAAGDHWFDTDTMKFFGTRIEAQPDQHNMFITSEDPPFGDYSLGKRAYSIRKFNPESSGVNTVGEFRGYSTLEEAKKARRSMWG